MSLFVVGTGTAVGKTVVSALLLARYGRDGRLGYWKPVATGSAEERDTATVARLSGVPAAAILPERYGFEPPVSPHLAARLAGVAIETSEISQVFARHRAAWAGPERGLVVEGVGGVLVPLNDSELLIDLIDDLALPCLVVAAAGLGTINHTLLTLAALESRGVAPVGVVLSGAPHGENRRAIERFGAVPVVAEVPWLEPLDALSVAAAATRFDPDDRLRASLFGGPA